LVFPALSGQGDSEGIGSSDSAERILPSLLARLAPVIFEDSTKGNFGYFGGVRWAGL
jgi:hypothetical protein